MVPSIGLPSFHFVFHEEKQEGFRKNQKAIYAIASVIAGSFLHTVVLQSGAHSRPHY